MSEDTISRAAAIRWVKTECNPYGKPTLDFESGKKVIEHLKQMPSAQPKKRTEKRTETHTCDLISRQSAIDAVYKCDDIFVGDMPVMVVKADAYEALAQLPPAQPDLSGYSDKLWKAAYERGKAEAQRKKGMWIEHNPHKWGLGIVFECSECGEKIDCEPSNYCPNCGADMRTPVEIARNIVHEVIDNSVWSDAVDTTEMHKVVEDKYAEMAEGSECWNT